MGCSSCGGGVKANSEYEITYRHDGSKERVSDLVQVRMKISTSPQGGTYQMVPKK